MTVKAGTALTSLPDLFKSCKFRVTKDKRGNLILFGQCDLRNAEGKLKTVSKSVNLTQLADSIAQQMVRVDRALDSQEVGIVPLDSMSGGWLADAYTKATSIAKRIGQNRIARDIYQDVLPEVAPFVPGGSAAMSIVDKAHKVWEQAKDGIPAAREKVRALVAAKNAGNGAASQAVSLMRNFNRLWQQKQRYEGHQGEGEESLASGFVYNRPYRDVMTAKMDTKDPGTILRFLYNEGAS